jgi:hypothetical protein
MTPWDSAPPLLFPLRCRVAATANSKTIDQNPFSVAFDICLVVELYKQTPFAYHTESGT